MQVARNTFILIALGYVFTSAMADPIRVGSSSIRQLDTQTKTKSTSPVAPTTTTTTTPTPTPPSTPTTFPSFPSASFSPVQVRF